MAKPKRDAKEQSKRFIEKARELEADETGEEFERTFKKVVPPKRANVNSTANYQNSSKTQRDP